MTRLIKNAGILAWREDDFYFIPKGYIGIENDVIVYLSDKAPKEKYDTEMNMAGRIIMPGLINSHAHTAMTLLRGVGSDLPLDKWLFDTIFPIEARMTAEDIKAGNALGMMEMIASGTTSFSDMYFEVPTLMELNETIGMKCNALRVVMVDHPDQPGHPEDTAERTPRIPQAEKYYQDYHLTQNGRVRIDFSVHGEYTCNDDIARGIALKALTHRDTGINIHMHVSETQSEHRDCIRRHGCTPTAWSESMGLLDVPAFFAHCVWVTKQDMKIMKKHGVSAVHCPTSNMKLGSGFAPIPALLKAGINVGLGTDGCASNNNLNMFEEMHLAAVIHKGNHCDPEIVTPKEVLKMATINGAKIQGREDTGCLAVGKKADMIALDFRNKSHLYPNFDPMALLVYSAQASDVCMTMVDGQILYQNGRFFTLDKKQVLRDAKAAVKRLYQSK